MTSISQYLVCARATVVPVATITGNTIRRHKIASAMVPVLSSSIGSMWPRDVLVRFSPENGPENSSFGEGRPGNQGDA